MESRLIPIDLIEPDAGQPRKKFESAALWELAESIEQTGLLQAITVRPKGDGIRWIIIAGERRWRAHGLLAANGRLEPPVIQANIRDDMSAEAVAIAQIVENLARVDVSPLEEADAFAQLVAAGMEPAEIARRCGVAIFRVNWRLSLQNLAPDIRALFASGNITQQQANEIARLDNHGDQHRIMGLLTSGKVTGWKPIRTAVEATIEARAQQNIFDTFSLRSPMDPIKRVPGDEEPKLLAIRARQEDVDTVSRMEEVVERIAGLAAAGFENGACTIATKVRPDRARLLSDRLEAIRSCIGTMQRELKLAAAKSEVEAMVMEAA